MKLNKTDIIILTLILASSAYFYTGFYFPDYSLLSSLKFKITLYSIRILFPVVIATIIWVYVGLRRGIISKNNVLLSLASIMISLLIIFHVIIIRDASTNEALEQFHPYLQLMPNPIDMKALQDKSSFLIVCLGGSTTEFRDSKGAGWPEYLENNLNDAGLKKVTVLNCGKQWYSSLHMLINYQTNIRQFSPDMIIIMEAINDLLQNADQSYFSSGPLRPDYGHFYGPVNRIARNRGIFEEYLSDGLLKLWYQKPREVLELDSFPGLISYRRNIQTIIDLASIDHSKVVLMTQPTLLKENMPENEKRMLLMVNHETLGKKTCWSYSTACRGMKQYNDTMRSIANEKKLLLIDLEKTVPKSIEYFHDDVHYQDKAYPLIACTISESLISRSIITKK